ncbi:class I SAM-dependent methyltransferase [Chloroflexota bacterium]
MSVKILSQLKQNILRKTFKTCVKCYDTVFDFLFYLPCGGETSFREKCVKFADLTAGDRVLDLCCGTGGLTIAIAGQGLAVDLVGVDISESAIEIASIKARRMPVTFLRASADDLPFKSSQFDKCFISLGLHHIPEQIIQKALIEIHRTLAPKGTLYVIEYNLPERGLRRLAAITFTKLDTSKEAFKMLKSGSMVRKIKEAGFEIAEQVLACQGIIQLLKVVKA